QHHAADQRHGGECGPAEVGESVGVLQTGSPADLQEAGEKENEPGHGSTERGAQGSPASMRSGGGGTALVSRLRGRVRSAPIRQATPITCRILVSATASRFFPTTMRAMSGALTRNATPITVSTIIGRSKRPPRLVQS